MTTPRPRIVLLQGAFDILNYGHIRAFKFAKAQGDYLIVALNTNELIRDYKGREPVMPWSHKRSIIEACRYVDRVVPAHEFSPLKLLKRYGVDVYVISYEWEHTKAAEIAYMKQKGGRVCFSRRFRRRLDVGHQGNAAKRASRCTARDRSIGCRLWTRR